MARILLIEPDQVLASVVTDLLNNYGHKVEWQVELQAAMDSADKYNPELVILDLLLASRSGTEFLYEFRSYGEWRQVPVIIYSNVPPEFAKNDGYKQLQIANYLYKPETSLNQLQQAVRSALQTVKT